MSFARGRRYFAVAIPWLGIGMVAGVALVLAFRLLRSEPRSVVLITVSGLRADRVTGAAGMMPRCVETWRRGLTFTRAYTPAPCAAAAAASLLTGVPPEEHGVWDQGDRLRGQPVALADRLRDRGYPGVAFSGSGLPVQINGVRGFTAWAAALGDGSRVNQALFAWLDRRSPTARAEKFAAWLHYADLLPPYHSPGANTPPTAPATTRLDDWYAVAVDSRHLPSPAERERLNSGYTAAVLRLDQHLGALIEGLRQRGFTTENSVLVLAGLVGETLDDTGAERWYTHNHQLRPEVVQVPLLWSCSHRRSGAALATPILLTEVLARLESELDGDEAGCDPRLESARHETILIADLVRATGRYTAASVLDDVLVTGNGGSALGEGGVGWNSAAPQRQEEAGAQLQLRYRE